MSGRQASRGFGTRAISAATRPPRVDQLPDSVPVYQAVTFSAADSAELGDILADRQPGYAYARIDNPTAVAMAAAVAELEGAEAGYALATGIAAIHATLLALAGAGDHIVASRTLYGSSYSLLTRQFARLGIEVTFVDVGNPAAVESAITERTRVLFLETISNPTILVPDLPALAELAHRRGVAMVVDNTFASPYVCRPIEHGADVVVESATKWLGGHSDVHGGVAAGRADIIAQVRAVQIDTGATAAPWSAFLVLRGIETLHVRMDRHSETALTLAIMLEADQAVSRVHYPGLTSHPQHAVAARLLQPAGGMLAFDLGTRQRAAAFLDALEIPPRTASLGSVRTMCVHPPSSTHRQLDDAALDAAGIPAGLVRVSVGLEDAADLAADFRLGLAAARSVDQAASLATTA